MTFNLVKDGTNEVVLGPVSEDNVYIRAYGSVLAGYKLPKDLAVGETTRVRYSLSMGKPTVYMVVRTE